MRSQAMTMTITLKTVKLNMIVMKLSLPRKCILKLLYSPVGGGREDVDWVVEKEDEEQAEEDMAKVTRGTRAKMKVGGARLQTVEAGG